MKKLYSLLFAFTVILASCSTDSEEAYEGLEEKNFTVDASYEDLTGKSGTQTCAVTTIIADETIIAGKVYAESDGDNLIITFVTDTSWMIDVTNLYIGSENEIPTWSSGVPRTSHFPYRATHGPGVNKVVYSIPLTDITDDCFAVLGHAIVTKYTESGNPIYCTNSWINGKQVVSSSWAMKTSMCKSGCKLTRKPQPVIEVR